MSTTPGNSSNITTTGVVSFTGTAMSGSPTTQYAIQVGGPNNTLTSIGPGSAGQVLQSGGASANPAYTTATYPSVAGTASNVITSDGTNFNSTASIGGGGRAYPYFANVNPVYYYCPYPFTTASSTGFVGNRTNLYAYYTAQPWTVTAMGLICASFVSTTTLRLGIYTMDTSTGAASLLVDFGTLVVTGTGYAVKTSLSQLLNPGFYYFAVSLVSGSSMYNFGNGGFFEVIITNAVNGAKGLVYNAGVNTFPPTITQANLAGASSSTSPLLILLQGT